MLRARCQASSSTPRAYGCFTRSGEYRYDEAEMPRAQPRGSCGGSAGSIVG
jgi:hypothetical protein